MMRAATLGLLVLAILWLVLRTTHRETPASTPFSAGENREFLSAAEVEAGVEAHEPTDLNETTAALDGLIQSATSPRALPARASHWDEYPRTARGLLLGLTDGVHGFGAEHVFRHVELNPRDIVIPLETCEAFAVAFEASLAISRKVLEGVAQTAHVEFDALRRAGRARSRTIQDYVMDLPRDARAEYDERYAEQRSVWRARLVEAGLSPAQIEQNLSSLTVVNPSKVLPFEPYASFVDGETIWGAELEELPRASGQYEILLERALTQLGIATSFMRAYAGLTAREEQAVLAKASEEAARKLGR